MESYVKLWSLSFKAVKFEPIIVFVVFPGGLSRWSFPMVFPGGLPRWSLTKNTSSIMSPIIRTLL